MNLIEEYISKFPVDVSEKLSIVRQEILKVAPTATETISYGIPTFKVDAKNLIHFAGFAKHIGLYPGPDAINHFKQELKDYKTSKGAIQFPLDKTIPLALINKITTYCLSQIKNKKPA